jgi:transcriptional regulator
MQQPAVFHEDRPEILHDFIERNSFAMLVTVQGDEPAADHLPLHLKKVGAEGRAVLQGHLAAVNRLGRTTEVPRHALAVFQGAQSYISPSWYPSKAAHGKVVPTWNYVAVHARGLLRLHKDEDWLLRHLDELTRRHESARPVPWSVSDAPREFIARQLRGLVGLEIEITGLQGVWKASQNKTAEDAAGVAAGLRQVDAPQSSAMAALVSMLGNRRPGTQEP